MGEIIQLFYPNFYIIVFSSANPTKEQYENVNKHTVAASNVHLKREVQAIVPAIQLSLSHTCHSLSSFPILAPSLITAHHTLITFTHFFTSHHTITAK